MELFNTVGGDDPSRDQHRNMNEIRSKVII